MLSQDLRMGAEGRQAENLIEKERRPVGFEHVKKGQGDRVHFTVPSEQKKANGSKADYC